MAIATDQDLDMIGLDLALQKLAALDPDPSRMVELRFFGGLTVEETAQVMEHLSHRETIVEFRACVPASRDFGRSRRAPPGRRGYQIFESALDQPATERNAFIDLQCEGDTALRSEVEALLSIPDESGTFLNQPAADLAVMLVEVEESSSGDRPRVPQAISAGTLHRPRMTPVRSGSPAGVTRPTNAKSPSRW